MRTLAGVLVVLLVLAPLAAGAVRGLARAEPVDDGGRTTLQTLVEGLVVLAVLVGGVLVAVALLD